MVKVFPTNKIPFTLVIGVQTTAPCEIKIEAQDANKLHTFYANRKGIVNGYREFEVKFPQSPANAAVSVYNIANGNVIGRTDPSFTITKIAAKPLETRAIWQSAQDRSFVKFAQWFSENAANFTSGDMIPHIYRSDDAQFTIDYYNKIRDRQTGAFVNTPARIGHDKGIIEVSKKDFLTYTVPMRMIILLHEYSHKWKNPKNNLDMANEAAADIAALDMYLSLGYSPMEAHQAFLYVFNGAKTPENHKRYLIIKDYIEKFERGELDKYYSDGAMPVKKAA